VDSGIAALVLSALAQPTRLEAFRLLIQAEPDGLPAGELARRLGVPHNTLSAHLATLSNRGLVKSKKQSRHVIYRAEFTRFRAVLAYLVWDCCAGSPEICARVLAGILPTCTTPGASDG
jgi:ArsR family transcriptional regulator, arsenate/arsenite/antimonite-responsive transcriptional repressor